MLTKADKEQGHGPDGQPAGRTAAWHSIGGSRPWEGMPKECKERKADPLPKESDNENPHRHNPPA